jgi:cyclopropane fatty-acyl-phospholipid synthase-like methyltransferase
MTQPEHRRRIARYYQETQFFYDWFWTHDSSFSMNYGFWIDGTHRLRDALLQQNQAIAKKLSVTSSDVVLEAGCGTGGTTVWLAMRHGLRAVGITLSAMQARRARAIARKHGVAHLASFAVMDFSETAFPDGSFTRIFASESVCYAERKSDFLAEASRLLKGGGRLVVTDGFRHARENTDQERKQLIEWCDGWAVPALATVEEFRDALHGAGFRNVEFVDETAYIMPSARRIYLRGLLAYPLAIVLARMGIVTPVQVGHVRASIRQYALLNARVGRYGTFVAQR